MANSFQYHFNKGYEKIVLIGSDIPTLTVDTIVESFRLLKTSDSVLGPGFDGGYYLIGMKKLFPELFKGISWSTSRVFDETMAIISKNNISFNTLKSMRDIDNFEELIKLYDELKDRDKNSVDFPIHTWEVLCELKL